VASPHPIVEVGIVEVGAGGPEKLRLYSLDTNPAVPHAKLRERRIWTTMLHHVSRSVNTKDYFRE
jgi:hypothetical protein